MWFFACSGPGAMATIAGNIAFSRQQASVVGLLTAASLAIWAVSNRRMRYPAVCLLLLSFHPAWAMSATHGDCGYGMASSALWATLSALLTVVMQIRYAVRLRRSKVKRPTRAST